MLIQKHLTMKKLSLLNSALSQTKSQRQNLLKKTPASKPYISNAELEKIREEEYYRKMEEKKRKRGLLQQEASSLPEMKRRCVGAENGTKNDASLGDEEKSDSTTAAEVPEDEQIPEPLQVMKLLRQYKEPITLFGESNLERWSRLKFVEKKYTEMMNEQNTYQKHMREEEEARRERELTRGYGVGSIVAAGFAGNGNQNGDAAGTAEHNSNTPQHSTPLPTWKTAKLKTKEEYIIYMINRLLDEWRFYLAQRPEEEQKLAVAKREFANWKQTTQYLEPLIAKLKSRTMDKDQLNFFSKIFSYVAEREYVMANDQYLQLAIGNAPWPMGVESVGIHARSAREKISSRNVAHVLNDDTQRKYIQSVKRLMTFAQKKYPTIPSKMVQV